MKTFTAPFKGRDSRSPRLWIALLALALLVTALLVQQTPAMAAETTSRAAQENDEAGVLVVRVIPGSPAAEAGLRRGDRIVSVDEEAVNSAAELAQVIRGTQPADEIQITYRRGDEERTTRVTVGERSEQPFLGIMPGPATRSFPKEHMPFSPREGRMPFAMKDALTGAFIVDVSEGSAAENAGLQSGEVIVAIDDETVESAEDLVEAIGQHSPGESITLEVRTRDGETHSVTAILSEHAEDAERALLGVQLGSPLQMFRFHGHRPDTSMMPGLRLPLAGVLVVEVVANSPAAQAGLQVGDFIVEVDGEAVDSFDTLRAIIGDLDPGTRLDLTVRSLTEMSGAARDEEQETRTVTVELGEKEGNAFLGIAAAPTRGKRMQRALPGEFNFEEMRPRLRGERGDREWDNSDWGNTEWGHRGDRGVFQTAPNRGPIHFFFKRGSMPGFLTPRAKDGVETQGGPAPERPALQISNL